MTDWINAFLFAVAVMAFALGLTSIIMSFMTTETGNKGMQEKIEYGFFGVSGIVVCLLMGYALA
ncbi:hypothetical protein GTH32_15370 [Alteromonas sp. 345S023]|uniref:DUF350 domain-containing protein n=1 Tax=Alteromonas profundi TaxID=2696062 RepID=A0A7X5RLZ1_9ALTE|nr:hypothetical protein [Alteromonas profundi]NDV92553.1 hypothetical protein [Alteromonas profundi]